MASSGERRLLFDTRGRRRHVIRVVYAILALLMGGSLFLVVGPFNLASLVGNSSGGGSATEVFEEQTERIERRLAKSPEDEQLLLSLIRAQIGAGNAQLERTSEFERPIVTAGAREDFQAGMETWRRYLKRAGDEPNAGAAQLVSATSLSLAETSTTVPEAQANVAAAAAAQRIVAEQLPSVGSLTTAAFYDYLAGDFAAGDEATKQAAAKAATKTEAKEIEKQAAAYRKRGKEFAKLKTKAAKLQQKAGKEALQNPFRGLGGTTGAAVGE